MRVPIHKNLFLVVIISLSFLFAHTWVSYISFHYPYIGLAVEKNSDGKWLVTDFYKNGIAIDTGILLHDEVISINNLPVVQHFTVYKLNSIEQVNSIQILNDGALIDYDLREEHGLFSQRLIFATIAEFICLALAVFLYIKSSNIKSTNILIIIFMLMGLSFMSAEASAKSDIFSKILIFTSITLIPFLMLHFLYQLLKEKGQSYFSYKFINLCYAVVIPYCLLRIAYFLPGFTYKLYNIDRLLMLIFFVIGSLCCLLFLWIVYRKRRLEFSYSASIIKMVLIAFSICFIPYLIFTVIPDIISEPIVDYVHGIRFIALFPFIFIYLSYKRNLFLFKQTRLNNFFFNISSMVWKSSYFTSIQRLLASLQYVKSFQDFKHHFLTDICNIFNYSNAILFIIENEDTHCFSAHPVDKEKWIEIVHSGEIAFEQYAIFSISREQQYQTYLILEHGKPIKKINRRTHTIVETIRVALVLLIENIYINQNLSKEITQMLDHNDDSLITNKIPSLKRTIFQLLEQEHKQMASDLHDTLLQDLLFARQRVLSLRNSVHSTPALDHQLADLAEYLQIINLGARDTIFQIYPHLLKETGFAMTVSNLVETERSHSEADIILSIEHADEWNKLSFDDLLQIFRIIQELLSNARKHAHAKQIKLHFTLFKGKYFIITYTDDGVGIANYDQFQKTGWSGIQHRLQSIFANIVIDSTKQSGLSLKITIPKLGVQQNEYTSSNY